jgi:hypothetical protein
LPAAIPQVQCQVSHELRVAVLNIDSCTKTAHIFCDIVTEDYRAHGGFAGAALAHEQHLLFLLTVVHVGICGDDGRWGFAMIFVVKTCGSYLRLVSIFGVIRFAFQSPKLN